MYLVCLGTYLFLLLSPASQDVEGVLCDANMLVHDVQRPPAHPDMDRGDNKDCCQEDEEYFQSRPDAETMEKAIG